MKHMNNLALLLLSLSQSHATPRTTYFNQQQYTTKPNMISRRKVKGSIVRGLSWQENLFNNGRTVGKGEDDEVVIADKEPPPLFQEPDDPRNDVVARRKMNQKTKGKGMRKSDDDSSDESYDKDEMEVEEFDEAPSIEDPLLPGAELFVPLSSTKEPTKKPTIETTKRPTTSPATSANRPTPSPTRIPTTKQPTTISPSFQPPTVPTSPSIPSTTCQADSNGEFGIQRGSSTQVDFLYQMEIFAGMSIKEAITQIEAVTVNLLLPEMFPQECSPMRRKRRQLQAVTDDTAESEYVGISSAPPDTLAAGFECVGVFSTPCFVVRGWVTAFSEGKSTDEVKKEVASFINAILESGEIERLIVDVEKATSLRESDMALATVPGMAPSNAPPNGVSSLQNSNNDSAGNPTSVTRESMEPQSSEMVPTIEPNLDQPSSAGEDDTTSSESPAVTDTSSANGINVPNEKPFILRFPWWGWVAIVLGILALWGLKVAVDRRLARKDTDMN